MSTIVIETTPAAVVQIETTSVTVVEVDTATIGPAAAAAWAAALAGKVDRANTVVTVDDQVGATDRAKLIAALSGATTLGGMVLLPDRTIDVGNGLSLAGYSCGIQGRGAGHSAAPNRSVIKASTQTGPVLDFTGYLFPDSFMGRQSVGGFAVQGSGVADPTKVRSGIKLPSTSAGSMSFHDIVISGTGGPCLDADSAYLCTFDRITLVTPVGAQANDVPYALLKGCNGNTFNSLGLRSITASADTGHSGALIITDNGAGTFTSEGNQFNGTWIEYLHVPTDGCYISCAANTQTFTDTYFVDQSKEAGATGTAYVRFLNAVAQNAGGNTWRGVVPGHDPGSAVSIDTGISITQPRNHIEGVKGYRGANVTLNAGVANTFISLGGGVAAATDAGVIDNSGNATNTYIDHFLMAARMGSYVLADASGGPRFSNQAVPANGLLALGTSGVILRAIGTNSSHYSDSHNFKNIDGSDNGYVDKYVGWSLRGGLALPVIGSTTAAPASGAAGALPATPAGYVTVTINGTARKIPYY